VPGAGGIGVHSASASAVKNGNGKGDSRPRNFKINNIKSTYILGSIS